MVDSEEPSQANAFLAGHVAILRHSLKHWTGRDLIEPAIEGERAAEWLFQAPFAVLSHSADPDPLFTYGNRAAMDLFELSWADLVQLPSRLSAEPVNQEMRARLLQEVSSKGFIDHYTGVRISRSGRQFLIEDAVVWNLLDPEGAYCGQAAMFSRWRWL